MSRVFGISSRVFPGYSTDLDREIRKIRAARIEECLLVAVWLIS